MDFVLAGTLTQVDGVAARGVEEIKLSHRVSDGERAIVIPVSNPVALGVAENHGGEHGAFFVRGTFNLKHDGDGRLVIAGGVDGEVYGEVVAVFGIGDLDGVMLGGEAQPRVVGESASLVEQCIVFA